MDFLFNFPGQIFINEFLQKSFLSYFHLFFLFLNLLDTTPYYLTLCGFIRCSLAPKISTRYIYLLSFLPFSASFFKHLFNLQRPGYINPELDLVPIGTRHGFPSGAAIGAVIISALIFRHFPSVKGKIFAFFYLFLMCLSRLYLGAHFLIDVLGGLIFGGLIWLFYLAIEKKLISLKEPMGCLKFVSLSALFFVLMCLIHPKTTTHEIVLMLSGFSLGRFFIRKNLKTEVSMKSFLIMALGLYLLFFLTLVPFFSVKILGLFLVGVWLSSGCLLAISYLGE